jgi:hypothetical protein
MVEMWVDLAQNDFAEIIVNEREWCPLRTQNSVPRHHSVIQSSPLHGHPALTSAFEPIVVVTMPRVAVTCKSVIDKMTY